MLYRDNKLEKSGTGLTISDFKHIVDGYQKPRFSS